MGVTAYRRGSETATDLTHRSDPPASDSVRLCSEAFSRARRHAHTPTRPYTLPAPDSYA
jgi:hypothetical protein